MLKIVLVNNTVWLVWTNIIMMFLKSVRTRLLTKNKEKASGTSDNLILISFLIYLKYCEFGLTPLKYVTKAKGGNLVS